ncbi:hypothetical protein [Ancylobacter defluvii]|uniref:Uncharacterized protein n=1 Tax=Ancylobacter defluvii TaxID=1282440 RepID=A0A9W6JX41_9HYPH|nr:hypothetical protein [Ancylobacter defluvii]MBS7587874.1 hypothetical protein [Ancylobacter defluvii]GLK83705.1 hypothetical protein GCM10017653_17740 [Ancylobacter defluvii]
MPCNETGDRAALLEAKHATYFISGIAFSQENVIASACFLAVNSIEPPLYEPHRCVDYVRDNVFGIDFDEKSVRVSRGLACREIRTSSSSDRPISTR